MKKNCLNLILLLVLLSNAPNISAQHGVSRWGQTIFVSPNGNDKNPGTKEKPVASFLRAQKLVRKIPADQAVLVNFANGTYYLPQTILFTAVDNKQSVTWEAEEEGKAILSGGSLLQLKWKPFKNGILVAEVSGKPVIDQLYVNGARQRMARFPNAVSGKNVFDCWDLSHQAKADPANDPLTPARIARWKNPEGGYIHAMHSALWGDMHWIIKGKNADGSLIDEGGWQNNRPSKMHPVYRMVENIFEELDAPGEWFFNTKEQKLYYMPEAGIDMTTAKVEIVRLRHLVEFSGSKDNPVRSVHLKGFVFRHTARTFMDNKEPLLRSDWTVYRGGAVIYNGAEDCSIVDCEFDQVGGNTIFVNNYNRRITIRGCYIHHSGANGIAFVGDPATVRSPIFRYGKQDYAAIDRTPGPKGDNFPEDCLVEDCLITMTGRDEKQTAPVHISMSHKIRVNHCSVYDVPRAGININEGTFGGHIIENCDIFNTVLETGDHGSFNSWGRDRFWTPDINETVPEVAKEPGLPFLDMLEPNIIRNSRWRCDHGWDIDLDDGSTNYQIYNNLLLNGGLKMREGYHRTATNNVIINNGLHPHAWYSNCGDVFSKNIVFKSCQPAVMDRSNARDGKWGKELDYNFFVATKKVMNKYALNGCDLHSLNGNPLFADPSKGDFSVGENSPALKTGFVNFPMDQFGVTRPSLKALAKTPEIPVININTEEKIDTVAKPSYTWMQIRLKEPSGAELSAYGVSFGSGGVALPVVPENSEAFRLGFRSGDLIQEINGTDIHTIQKLSEYTSVQPIEAKKHLFLLIRNQEKIKLTIRQNLANVLPSTTAQTPSKSSDNLEDRFKNPPVAVRPYVWWHWMGSNFSKEGITKDLEAMKAQGIGGATIFNLASAVQESHAPTLNNPWPEQTYRSPAYWEAIRFAAAEAQRLGLEIGLHNTVGYSTTGGPWIDEERSMQRLVWSDSTVTGGADLLLQLKAPTLVADEGWGKTGRKISFYKDIAVLAVPADKKEITAGEVLNLTDQYSASAGLKWKVPAGNWTVYRIGHASTGRPPHPIPDDLLGKSLEADKMSKEQSTWHWKMVLDPFKEHLGEYLGKSFKHMLIDSYEAGNQNWTPGFREEFIKRKGYDPIPWLATFSQTVGTAKDSKDRRTIGSAEQTRRFDWDYRDVIDQLFYDNGWNIGRQKLKEAKLDLQMEPYGGPFDTPRGVALSDLPMAEFWTGGIGGINGAVPASARAAGKTVVGAEAFTGRPETSQFTEDPAFLKPSADKTFAAGINRMILHHWVHQPFDDRYQPGMGMGWWGTHFGRNQTWVEPGKAFFSYLSRCQAMLQFGEQPADYLCLDKTEGFSDLISTDQFLKDQIKVLKGKIHLASGRNYPFLLIPGEGEMLPEVARKIEKLVGEGAIVVSQKPLRTPSLKDYPQCDGELKKLGDEVWGNGSSNKYKNGLVFTKLEDAILKTGIQADFVIEKAARPADIKIAHRQTVDVDIYFVANQSDKEQSVAVSFRIAGKQPELWQAEDGNISEAPVWSEKEGRTTVSLNLKGIQSVFVVFRKPTSKTDHPVSVSAKDSLFNWNVTTNKEGIAVMAASNSGTANVIYASGKQKMVELASQAPILLKGAWKVSFVPKNDKKFDMDFSELVDFSKHHSTAVNYFSGTATYHKKVVLEASALKGNQRILLGLGEMNDIAAVRVNGKSQGILWYPPYRADITDALKAGENDLEIAVTNNWANRLIGDEKEPADFEWGKDRGEKMGRAMLAYPDWFIKNQPRPSQGRKTFSIWYYYRDNSTLKPAGLVGPVRLIFESEVKL